MHIFPFIYKLDIISYFPRGCNGGTATDLNSAYMYIISRDACLHNSAGA